jgi:6-pyruvoyltetrahydropterin/6-carboxytetrahydropterin synthase
MLVVKRSSFDAAHRLPGYPGKCSQLHGHHWVLEVGYEGSVNTYTGMVVDFTQLKGVLQPIVDMLDHSYLNDRVENPTAENLVGYVLELLPGLFMKAELALIRIWETETAYAEWRKE